MEVTALQKLINFINNLSTDWEDILAKAEMLKKLEKQQITDAYETGDKYKFEISGEQYYENTYGKAN